MIDPPEVVLAAEARALWGADGGLEITSLTHNLANGVTQSIDRVTRGDHRAVVKVVGRRTEGVPPQWLPSDDPRHFNYWRREALAYTSDLAGAYAGSGLDAPELLARHERADGSVALWLEDVDGDPGPWTVDDVIEVARRLGVAQGHIAVETGPDHLWLSRRFLRTYATSKPVDYALLDSDSCWDHPLIAGHAPDGLRPGTKMLHDDAEWFFDLSERLPRTLCHLDLWPNNLERRTGGDLALVDWSFVGDGALGEDVSNLVVDSVFDHFLSANDLEQLDARAIPAYLDGLAEAGWNGDEQLVRLGVWSAAVKYQWLMPAQLALLDRPAVAYGGGVEVDPARRYADRLGGLGLLVDWAHRTRDLARGQAAAMPPHSSVTN